MDDVGDRFLDLVHDLEEITRSLTPEQAHAGFDETTLQVFWKRWPGRPARTGTRSSTRSGTAAEWPRSRT